MDSLQVDPGVIRATSGQLAEVAAELAAKSVTQSLGSAAHGMAGLQTGDACTHAATVFDSEFHQLGSNLTTMAQSLQKAADSYASTDAAAGQNIKHAGDSFGP
jgi:uncharacterized protein YukE